ncbi:MAG: hypothetical protein KAV42_08720 [Candidatus Krumholzibacteria bacterium]|nr:hypothetical protein [Candidatus Krumholzibacteria bacterium]
MNTRAVVIFLFLILASVFADISAAPLDIDGANAFLQQLLDDPGSIDRFISDDDRAIAGRMGITYIEAPCKPIISWGLSKKAFGQLIEVGVTGQFRVDELEEDFFRLTLFPDDSLLTQSWIFKGDRLVSSILYETRGWKQIDSPHFRFFVSDTTLFHPANITALESFLEKTALLLGLPESDMEMLAKEKIYYCFCGDQEEIRRLTGYPARGIYILSHDIVISTYSSHFHELAHLLMNLRLKQPHLITHPLLLEGFAVAAGGRGGRSRAILHQLGLQLHRAGWISPGELLATADFYQLDASMSYAGSAGYNAFLMENMEIEQYLELYAKYGGSALEVSKMRIDESELPLEVEWQRYLAEQPIEGTLVPGAEGFDAGSGPVTFQQLPDSRYFGFAVPEVFLVSDEVAPAGYQTGYRSFLFEELLPGQPYAGERFLIRASSVEVGVYDLFTNNMIAHYTAGLSADNIEIPVVDGLFFFRVDRSVFLAE